MGPLSMTLTDKSAVTRGGLHALHIADSQTSSVAYSSALARPPLTLFHFLANRWLRKNLAFICDMSVGTKGAGNRR